MLLVEEGRHVHSKAQPCPEPLNAVESEVVSLFAQAAKAFGLPPSVGQIYGLLFISERPMTMDDFTVRLDISKGSASQGLKFLRRVGAVNMLYVMDDRRVHYIAIAELRKLVTGFLKDQVLPQFDTGLQRLDQLSTMLNDLPSADKARFKKRIGTLRTWEKKTKTFLPMVVKLLGA